MCRARCCLAALAALATVLALAWRHLNALTFRRFLGSLPLVGFVELPMPAFRGRFASNGTGATSLSTLVLYSEEGGYFGQGPPWPGMHHNPRLMPGAEELTCRDARGVVAVRVRKNWQRAKVDSGSDVAALHVHVLHSPDWQSVRAVSNLRTAAARGSPVRSVFVHYSMETPIMWPADLDAQYMRLFELRWGYRRRTSMLPSVYFPTPPVLRLIKPDHAISWRRKAQSRVLTTAVSNCDDFAGRSHYVKALRSVLGSSFVNIGRCHPSERAESQAELARDGIKSFIARGFFYLALENANCDDYVTEKLGRALVSGVVPVVFDPPQSVVGTMAGTAAADDGVRVPGYARFLPPHTYVNVADFPSIQALAAHLLAASTNRTLYSSYLWPRTASAAEIRSRWPGYAAYRHGSKAPIGYRAANGGERAECLIAKEALARVGAAEERGEQPARLAPDASCLPPGQLCRYLPHGTCSAGGVADRIRPAVRGAVAKGVRGAVRLKGAAR